MKEFILLRHGETEGNLQHRYIGSTNDPLCDVGLRHASQYSFPEVRRVYVSPLRRCCETAHILFPNASMTLLGGLREMDFGVFENRSAAEMAEDAAYRRWVDSGCTAPCPGGEGLAGFSGRAVRAFCAAMAMEEDRAVFVAHGGTIMAILSRLADPARGYFEWRTPHCGGWRGDFDGDRILNYVPMEEPRL